MISNTFNDKLKMKYDEIQEFDEESFKAYATMDKKECVTQILELITQHTTCKILLAKLETQKQHQLMRYDGLFIELKKKYMDEGFKSTEAKENANKELFNEKNDLIRIEEDIALVKMAIHTVEYMLRLKYILLKED